MIKTDKHEYQFQTIDGTDIDDVPKYITEKLIHQPEGEIFIGCDSKVQRKWTIYEIIIAIRYPGKGAHIIHCRKNGEKHDRSRMLERLWREVEYVADLGWFMYNNLNRKITMHVDLSPNPIDQSHRVYKGAMGYLSGLHVPGRIEYAGKPNSWAAMRAADALTRK